MREVIKRYELNENINIYKLEKSEFKRKEPTDENQMLSYHYIKPFIEDIELQIDIIINKDGSFIFDEIEDITVYCEDYGQPYNAFYNEEKDFDFVNDIIKLYNKTMDSLVEKGIFKEKKLEETKQKTLGLINKEK